MGNAMNHDLVEAVLFRAADNLGDITEPSIALFYQRFPEAREMFRHHGGLRCCNLEGDMVQQALYCLMNWFHSPGEVEIVLLGSVPHHADTLKVPPDVYQGLLRATTEVIGNTIPADNAEERAAWQLMSDELDAVVAQSRRYITCPAATS